MAAIQIGREDVPPPRTPMAHPARNASPMAILSSTRVFFVTTKTSMARRLLQSEGNAVLLIDVLRSNVAAGKFQLHDFVIMPDHLHLLMTLPVDFTIEKAMQLIKGGFSYRLKREFGYRGEVWQRGMGRAFWSIATISFGTLSRQDSWIAPSSTPIASLTWPGKKRRG